MKDIHYFYKITNLINHKFYYGIRTCHCFPGQDPYMGSGVYLHRAFRKYGIHNFKKEVLRICKTRVDLKDLERWIVTDELVKDPMCYNLCVGGGESTAFEGVTVIIDGRNSIISKEEYHKNKGMYITPETGKVLVYDTLENSYKKISRESYYIEKESGRYIASASINKNRKTSKGKVPVKDKNGRSFLVDKNDPRYVSKELVHTWTGKRHKQESKDKISKANSENHKGSRNSMYGKTIVNNGIINKSIGLNELNKFLNDNPKWKRGKLFYKNIKKESVKNSAYTGSISLIYSFPELDNLKNLSKKPLKIIKKFRYTNGVHNVNIYESEVDEYESNGYWRGVTQFNGHKNHNPNSGCKEYKWINNGKINKFVKSDKVTSFIESGWNLGRIKKAV